MGYNTQTKEAGKKYPSFSACFVPVDGSATFKLKELKPTGMKSMNNDMIQTLNPATTVGDGLYLYFSLAESRELDSSGAYDEFVGWWKNAVGGENQGEVADETPITVGTAFLGQVVSGEGTSFQSSGEAPTYTTKFTTDGSMYPFFGNYLPKDLTLKDIVPVGMKSMNNEMIQTLDPATTGGNGLYLYFSLAESRELDSSGAYDEFVGWWKNAVGGNGEVADATPVPAGTAFLGQIPSGSAIEFQFPSVLAE